MLRSLHGYLAPGGVLGISDHIGLPENKNVISTECRFSEPLNWLSRRFEFNEALAGKPETTTAQHFRSKTGAS